MTSKIQFFSEGISFRLKEKTKIRKWIQGVILNEKSTTGAICFVFCSDELLLKLNKTHLKHNTLTDIISFPYSEKPGPVSGDIFISIPRVTENAQTFNQPFTRELSRVMIHGVLHLMGYSDKGKSRKALMTAKEDQYLLHYEMVMPAETNKQVV